MYNDVFKSLNESVKKRNSPSDFVPVKSDKLKEVIHRGYIRSTGIPIKYDIIPDGKSGNSGKHIYHFKNGQTSGILEIDHKYAPMNSGHETRSKIHFELTGGQITETFNEMIEVFRSIIVPSFMHHVKSHKPDIIEFSDSVPHSDDLLRRLGSGFEISGKTAKRKIDPKITRMITHIRNINKNKGK